MVRAAPLAAVFLVACATLPAREAIIEVAPPVGEQSQDRARIVEALERAKPGDTVRFAAGTYKVGPLIRVVTPDLTLLGHPDGTTLRGGEIDPGAGYDQFGDDELAVDNLGLLHLLEGGCTVRGLTFADSWFGLVLGWHYDEVQPKRQGGFLIEGNTFRQSQNGVRSTNTGATPTVIRGNVFLDVHYGVSALGSGFVVASNTFTMSKPPRPQGYGEAVVIAAEHVAGGCSDNRVESNTISGQGLGVGMYTDGSRAGTGNVIRGNRITLQDGTELTTGVDLRVRADRDSDAPPTGGLVGTVIEENEVTGATRAAISIGAGCNDTRVFSNTFSELRGPAILLGGSGTEVRGHAPDIEIRHAETSGQPAAGNP